MLVLSREVGQVIYVNGEEIKITVVDIRGNRVRLGIDAPPHMPIHRKEVYEAIQMEKQGSGKPYAEGSNVNQENSKGLEGELK